MCRDRGSWCRGDRGARCVAIDRGSWCRGDRGSRCVTLEDRGVSRLRIEDRGVANNYIQATEILSRSIVMRFIKNCRQNRALVKWQIRMRKYNSYTTNVYVKHTHTAVCVSPGPRKYPLQYQGLQLAEEPHNLPSNIRAFLEEDSCHMLGYHLYSYPSLTLVYSTQLNITVITESLCSTPPAFGNENSTNEARYTNCNSNH